MHDSYMKTSIPLGCCINFLDFVSRISQQVWVELCPLASEKSFELSVIISVSFRTTLLWRKKTNISECWFKELFVSGWPAEPAAKVWVGFHWKQSLVLTMGQHTAQEHRSTGAHSTQVVAQPTTELPHSRVDQGSSGRSPTGSRRSRWPMNADSLGDSPTLPACAASRSHGFSPFLPAPGPSSSVPARSHKFLTSIVSLPLSIVSLSCFHGFPFSFPIWGCAGLKWKCKALALQQKQKLFWNMWTKWNNLKPSRSWRNNFCLNKNHHTFHTSINWTSTSMCVHS